MKGIFVAFSIIAVIFVILYFSRSNEGFCVLTPFLNMYDDLELDRKTRGILWADRGKYVAAFSPSDRPGQLERDRQLAYSVTSGLGGYDVNTSFNPGEYSFFRGAAPKIRTD